MKKIILLKDHHRGLETFKEGQEIEVSDDEYEFIMKYYMDLRIAQVEQEKTAKAFLKKVGKK